MSVQEWITLAVVGAAVVALATDRFAAPFVILTAVTSLLVARVIQPAGALSGFSSEATISIAALYVIAGAVQVTGALDGVTRRAIGGRPRGTEQHRATTRELGRILWPAGLISAFLYNTPTTAMLAPQVATWARRSRRSPSWYLMALNAAILLGGLVTSIGTTTNVVMSGLLERSHQSGLGVFELTPVGLPIALVGILLVSLVGPYLVTGRQGPSDPDEDAREYSLTMTVAGAGLAGQSVAEAGLRNLDGVYLVEIARGDRVLAPVAPGEVLAEGDRLVFAGNIARVLDLQRIQGLVSTEHPHFSAAQARERVFHEAVVASGSPLVGRTLKELDFRDRYQAAVVAIHRHGERAEGKLGSVRLHAGDVLLVLTAGDFHRRWRGTGDFGLVAPLVNVAPIRRERAPLVWLIVTAFLAVAVTGAVPLLEMSLVCALVLVGAGVLSLQEARAAIDLDVIVVLAGSFGLGDAIDSSGLGRDFARLLVNVTGGLGDLGVLAAILIATVVITQLVTNNATAILMFPVALAAAAQIHANPRAFAIAVAVGASASFLTPIGYQTNMMVYGLGGYRFHDFLRLGTVLAVAVCAVALLAIPLAFPLH